MFGAVLDAFEASLAHVGVEALVGSSLGTFRVSLGLSRGFGVVLGFLLVGLAVPILFVADTVCLLARVAAGEYLGQTR